MLLTAQPQLGLVAQSYRLQVFFEMDVGLALVI